MLSKPEIEMMNRNVHAAYVDGWNKAIARAHEIALAVTRESELELPPGAAGMIDEAMFIGFEKGARRIAKQIKSLKVATQTPPQQRQDAAPNAD